MVGRSHKSKAARRRNNMKKKNKRDNERLLKSDEEMIVDDDGDGCLFMRAFGTAREVINVTRILSGMPSVLIERDDKRTPLSVEIQGDELDELSETIDQLGPELKRLCHFKSKSMADKAKHAAENPVPRTPAEKIPSDALVPLRRGKAISANSLHLTASGRAKSLSNYVRVLSGLPEEKSKKQAVETLDIEGEHLEELLVCLEKLGSSFKKRPRPSLEERLFDFGGEEPPRSSGPRSPRSNQGRPRSGNTGGRPPRRDRHRHRRGSFDDDEMIATDFLSFLFSRLFF